VVFHSKHNIRTGDASADSQQNLLLEPFYRPGCRDDSLHDPVAECGSHTVKLRHRQASNVTGCEPLPTVQPNDNVRPIQLGQSRAGHLSPYPYPAQNQITLLAFLHSCGSTIWLWRLHMHDGAVLHTSLLAEHCRPIRRRRTRQTRALSGPALCPLGQRGCR
jgi:hypothetical protein